MHTDFMPMLPILTFGSCFSFIETMSEPSLGRIQVKYITNQMAPSSHLVEKVSCFVEVWGLIDTAVIQNDNMNIHPGEREKLHVET